ADFSIDLGLGDAFAGFQPGIERAQNGGGALAGRTIDGNQIAAAVDADIQLLFDPRQMLAMRPGQGAQQLVVVEFQRRARRLLGAQASTLVSARTPCRLLAVPRSIFTSATVPIRAASAITCTGCRYGVRPIS